MIRLITRLPDWIRYLVTAACGAALAFGAMALHQRRRAQHAARMALSDPLTGVGNRLALDHQLAIDWQRWKRCGDGLSVLVLDLDGFKEVNDKKGRAAGDRMLGATAATIKQVVRESDYVARLGGDEFVVINSHSDEPGVKRLASRLRASLDAAGIGGSIGGAQADNTDDDAQALLHRADLAMYADKGRSVSPAAATAAG